MRIIFWLHMVRPADQIGIRLFENSIRIEVIYFEQLEFSIIWKSTTFPVSLGNTQRNAISQRSCPWLVSLLCCLPVGHCLPPIRAFFITRLMQYDPITNIAQALWAPLEIITTTFGIKKSLMGIGVLQRSGFVGWLMWPINLSLCELALT